MDELEINDSLNESQRKKRSYIVEEVDIGAPVYRQRTLDATEFDKMMLREEITIKQHAASVMLVRDLSRSGAYLRSPSLEPNHDRPSAYEHSLMRAARIIAMSGAMTRLRKLHTEKDITYLLYICSGMKSKDAKPIRKMLDTLASYYSI